MRTRWDILPGPFSASSGANQNAGAFPDGSVCDLGDQHQIVATTGKSGQAGVAYHASGAFQKRVGSISRKRHRHRSLALKRSREQEIKMPNIGKPHA
jgi:hypothetical protein